MPIFCPIVHQNSLPKYAACVILKRYGQNTRRLFVLFSGTRNICKDEDMKKEWFFDSYCGRQFAALIEDGVFAEFACEKTDDMCCVGDIFKGKATNVLSGMNAAFIQCGLDKNCYLALGETYTDHNKYDGAEGTWQQEDLHVGDEVLVQVLKPPRGNKGAKVTTKLSFVGKRLIYLPNTDFLGISRKITDEKTRQKLLAQVDKMRSGKTDGFIIRTQAPFATLKQLKTEAAYLKKLAKETYATAKKAEVGDAVYRDEDLPVRIMRDSFGDEIVSIRVGNRELYERLSKLIRLRGDLPERKLLLHTGERCMMQQYGILAEAERTAHPVVTLQNGAEIVIERTEAMTVIDVNTSRFVGDQDLEDTVFSVNLAAAKEIARQVRLRNVGGIVVVDFIDMVDEDHRIAVTEALKNHLSLDKAKCNILPMSELCLVQFTRERIGRDASERFLKPCPHCNGSGSVGDGVFGAAKLRAELMDCFAAGYKAAVVDIQEGLMKRILAEGWLSAEATGAWKDKRVYLIPHKTYSEEQFSVRGERKTVLTLPDKAQLLY